MELLLHPVLLLCVPDKPDHLHLDHPQPTCLSPVLQLLRILHQPKLQTCHQQHGGCGGGAHPAALLGQDWGPGHVCYVLWQICHRGNTFSASQGIRFFVQKLLLSQHHICLHLGFDSSEPHKPRLSMVIIDRTGGVQHGNLHNYRGLPQLLLPWYGSTGWLAQGLLISNCVMCIHIHNFIHFTVLCVASICCPHECCMDKLTYSPQVCIQTLNF